MTKAETMASDITVAKLLESMKRQKFYRQANGIMWSMLCPFHEEITPSLSLNPHKNTFHCYGCGKMGKLEELPFRMEE
jgi:DNA primase